MRIPSISFAGFSEHEVRRSADAVAALCRATGLEEVKVLHVGSAHPYVYAERMRHPDRPTLLLYAHHDVQPPGREALWKSPPFEPTRRAGPGGERLYGRGTADDKAGILIHLSAIEAWLQATGDLPVNVKLVIEGEEETGSRHLPEFLRSFRPMLDADALVLTDTTNLDCGKPALTVALRGLVGLEVEVRALTKTVHSGMWGGPLPDPVIALARMLGGLLDDDGGIALRELRRDIRALSPAEIRELEAVPYDEAEFREQSGLLPGARILDQGRPNLPPPARIWREPSLTVTAIQASSRAQAGNIVNDAAWAKVTVRLVPKMDPAHVIAVLKAHLRERCPWGLDVSFPSEGGSPAWEMPGEKTQGAAFKAARRALEAGYGSPSFLMGCGGSIPFVQPFADALGGVPTLLVGVEDPHTNAHGENESLLIGDFRSACRAQALLFGELGKLGKAGIRS